MTFLKYRFRHVHNELLDYQTHTLHLNNAGVSSDSSEVNEQDVNRLIFVSYRG
jgi:hypothetical protein